MFQVDWRTLFVPSASLLELVIRGSITYLAILAALRVFRRETGQMATADILVLVLVADAAQNAMAGEYKSITEGAVLVATIILWNFALDWLSYRSTWVHRLLNAPPVLLIRDGHVMRRNLRAEMLTVDELMAQLRQQGVERADQVKQCYIESDGHLSVIQKEETGGRQRQRKETVG